MGAMAVNSLLQGMSKNQPFAALTKAPPVVIDRNHYSAPSGGGGGYHTYSHSSHHHHGGNKHGIAMTALTLLAFLFFINILQNCIQDHMDEMNSPQIIIMSRLKAAKEAQKRQDEEPTGLINTGLKMKKELVKQPEKQPQNGLINIKPTPKRYEIKKIP